MGWRRFSRTRPVRGLENAAADYACLTNDLFSYQKEIQFEGELRNRVLVVQNFLGCDMLRAIEVVGDLMTSRMRQFQHHVGTDVTERRRPTSVNPLAPFSAYDMDVRRPRVGGRPASLWGGFVWRCKR